MNLSDCTPGREMVIAVRFLLDEATRPLGGVKCTVLETRPPPEDPYKDHPYPRGMVQVRLPDSVPWPCREPWIGPEDLGVLS